jgi:hypothetical protein
MKIGFWCREDELLNNFVFLNNVLDASYNRIENHWLNFYLYLKKKTIKLFL